MTLRTPLPFSSPHIITIALCAVLMALSCTQAASEVVFPPDAEIVDVTAAPYSAVGDGLADDTTAIQSALTALTGKQFGSATLYFPSGTYLVSDTLTWSHYLTVQGHSEHTTTIKLTDSATGFNDPLNAKPVLENAVGSGNLQAFGNYIFDLTVSVGSNNAGAIGLEYNGHNFASVRNVTIRSEDGQGRAAFSMVEASPGPFLVKGLTTHGFQYGIEANEFETTVTFEHVSLLGFTQAGVFNTNLIMTFRKLYTNGIGPAVLFGDETGIVTIVDSEFAGDLQATSAIQGGGGWYLRDVMSSGYISTTATLPSWVHEQSSKAPMTLFASADKVTASLGLPVEETPHVEWGSDFTTWANVRDFGADPDDGGLDDADAIQSAIDSGAEVIYFPSAQTAGSKLYHIFSPIVIRNNVRVMLFFHSTIRPGEYFRVTPDPVFRVDETSADFVTFDQMRVSWFPLFAAGEMVGQSMIHHNSPKPVVVRDSQIKFGYSSSHGAGPAYFENVISTEPMRFSQGQKAWARQWNTEGKEIRVASETVNDGADLWILGMKTERPVTAMTVINGGRTEILGGSISPSPLDTSDTLRPGIVIEDSSLSATYGTNHFQDSPACKTREYAIHVKERQNFVQRDLLRDSVPIAGGNSCIRFMGLFRASQ